MIICIVYAPIVCPYLLCGNSRIAVQKSPVSVSKISILLCFPPTINIALFSVVPEVVVVVVVVDDVVVVVLVVVDVVVKVLYWHM